MSTGSGSQVRNYVRAALFLFLLLGTNTGCATFAPVGRQFHKRAIGLTIPLPQGWLRHTRSGSAFIMTREGMQLNTISILVTKVGAKLPGTERTYQKGMLPNEIAELALGLIENLDETKNFDIDKIEYCQFLGRDAFKASASFTDPLGLRKRLLSFGTIVGERVCELRYIASESVYFAQHLDEFMVMVNSARLK